LEIVHRLPIAQNAPGIQIELAFRASFAERLFEELDPGKQLASYFHVPSAIRAFFIEHPWPNWPFTFSFERLPDCIVKFVQSATDGTTEFFKSVCR
jgi:hypothetical protein